MNRCVLRTVIVLRQRRSATVGSVHRPFYFWVYRLASQNLEKVSQLIKHVSTPNI
ncbi:unnamed protein product [Acanthoscelides obtectus]|uniref:Uncharacterized protein n=1 Tax=Acanthoscelides obtectus TaxID=200917 RepID=A0A9P0PJN6_ACAOB|nr:unnamed protein product [Acanthoscelides obtectus]CAK1643987.1 hypothetical protein AOBTE_LOCUS13766 [Acanthoscelides obtectus]